MFSLKVNSLEKSYGTTTVFENISFTHDNGRGVLGIAGPNGSGKSTLLKCLSGLLAPSAGSFSWLRNGEGITTRELRDYLGFTAPYVNLYDELTILENLQFLVRLRDLDTPREGLLEILKQLDIGQVTEQPFGKLSTGQQQRSRIASALIHKPDVLILDEPGANLDEEGHSIIKELIDGFRNRKLLVILASNDNRELQLCDRVYSVQKEHFTQD